MCRRSWKWRHAASRELTIHGRRATNREPANFLPPALGRVQIPALQALGPLWFFGVPTTLALACLVMDARRHRRVNRVLAAGSALMVASYIVRLALMTTAPWMTFAGWLTSYV